MVYLIILLYTAAAMWINREHAETDPETVIVCREYREVQKYKEYCSSF